MSLILDEHRQYLSDPVRMAAFQAAIQEVVKQGDVVLDLGAGTGILGLLACRAGATRLYSIESTDIIQLTRDICQANGFDGRTVFINEPSTRTSLPELVDVVVADQIGCFGFEAGLLEYFRDARKRFLKPGGITIPSRIDLIVAPVEAQPLWDQVEFWNSAPAEFDFRPVRALAENTGYPASFTPNQLLGDQAILTSLDASNAPPSLLGLTATVTVSRPGILHAIGGWFSATLSPSVTLTNSPLSEQRIDRQNMFFPLGRPVPVVPGDRILITMSILPEDLVITWNVVVQGATGDVTKASFSHSTFQGLLLSKEALQKTRPDFIPTLTPRGEARRTVLELCDGKKSLGEIERDVYLRHSTLFGSLDEAAKFVTEVMTRNSL
ncbi:MAG: 50S ribosomal protein L11 methyltransferase [Nitrospirae bacterium]|nr:50S ribosomal protein L11 methyltransferase [Nitrospirota bacterium]